MVSHSAVGEVTRQAVTDEEIVARVLAGDAALFEVIMRRHNQRLYRAARAILRDDSEAEDVMQEAYVRAYQNLRQFEGRSKFSTWLTRIAVHEALRRIRRRGRTEELDAMTDHAQHQHPPMLSQDDPELQAGKGQLRDTLEQAIAALPERYRAVFVLRDVEELSTAETAACLDLSPENVKVRLHRARALLRRDLYARAGHEANRAFSFHLSRCDRIVAAVLRRITQSGPQVVPRA